ncbi:MAG: anaerobic sulfatase maturase [Armatimonadetes bacterium]|nr:anaerobic sulfatase maturase [Armatimonadota bacterium]
MDPVVPFGRSRWRAFHVMAKPTGPMCNLECAYCFYLKKEALYPGRHSWRMDDETLERFIRQYIEAQQVPEVSFAWQGGEPTLLGVDFFRRVVALQKRYLPSGKRLINALQTNGTLLDDEWCEFLREHDFLVGLSLDGPREIHDRYRRDKQSRGTFDAVMAGLRRMQEHGVEFNILCVVNRLNSQHPVEIYRFFRDEGVQFVQFIPIVERLSATGPEVSEASVRPEDYGRFLCEIYDEWVRRDVGKVYVQLFEVAFAMWLGRGAALCVFEPTCGKGMALEHNGDLYSCDHYVFPEYFLGNIREKPLAELTEQPFQRKFGAEKRDALPGCCRRCDVRFLCHGECPKNRFLTTPEGEPGLNYLCAGLKRFFHHIGPTMEWMARAFEERRAPAGITEALQEGRGPRTHSGSAPPPPRRPTPPPPAPARPPKVTPGAIGRNDPCPCGSGRKRKRCCGAK